MSGLDLKRELRHMIITKLKCQVFSLFLSGVWVMFRIPTLSVYVKAKQRLSSSSVFGDLIPNVTLCSFLY